MNLFDEEPPLAALSLWQPWASLMALGMKSIETRPEWAMRLRHLIGRDLAICSTANTPRAEFAAAMMHDPLRDALVRRLPDYEPEAIVSPTTYQAGAVLAVVRVAAVVPMVDRWPTPGTSPCCYVGDDYPLTVWTGSGLKVGNMERGEEHDDERPFGHYAPGRVAVVTDHLRPLAEPVPCSGRQQVWHLPPAVEAAVREQVAA